MHPLRQAMKPKKLAAEKLLGFLCTLARFFLSLINQYFFTYSMAVQTQIQLFQKQSYCIDTFIELIFIHTADRVSGNTTEMAAPHKKYGRVQGSWPNVADSGSADSSGWKHYTDTWVPGRQWRGRAALNYNQDPGEKFLYSRTSGFQFQSQICPWICTKGDGRVQCPWCHFKSMWSEAGGKTPFVIWTLPHYANKAWATAGTGWS